MLALAQLFEATGIGRLPWRWPNGRSCCLGFFISLNLLDLARASIPVRLDFSRVGSGIFDSEDVCLL